MRTMTIRRLLTAAALITPAVARSGHAAAAVPGTITHQGRLYDTNDVPVTGTIDVQFSIYDSPGAAVPLWTEVHTVTFDSGYYSTALGSIVPFGSGVFNGSTRYFGLKVGTDAEMTPRTAVGSVPYALLAADVNGDIHPTSVSIGGATVIDSAGHWVGSPTGLVGPMGPQGAAGVQGPPGADGAMGPPGPMGPAGADGAMGPAGADGAMGPQGPMGLPGADGAAGPQGPMGPPGADGAAGPPGESVVGMSISIGDPSCPHGGTRFTLDGADTFACNGAPGADGPMGAPGAMGAAGPQGNAGPAGAAGPQGPQGNAGPAGADGAAGPQGPMGPPGADGAAGPPGESVVGMSISIGDPSCPHGGTRFTLNLDFAYPAPGAS